MERDEILRQILSDPLILDNYKLSKEEIETLKTNGLYTSKIHEVMSVIINENDNHLTSTMIYSRLKRVHNI